MESKKRIKIVYCTPSLYIPGGVERVLTVKVNYLADVCNYDVYIILTDGIGKEPYYALSPKVHIIQLDINFEELWHLSFLQKIPVYLQKQLIYRRKLKQALFSIKPDITVSLLRREINFLTSMKDGSKKVGEIHVNRNNYRNFEKDESNSFKKIFSQIWMHSLINKVKRLDKFIVLSQEDKLNWQELHNVEVIPNPLPFFTDNLSNLSSHKVIAVGRFVYQKGFDLLLKAWKDVHSKHPDWELNIFGEGDKTEYLALAKTLRISDCVFLENATPDIINKYTKSSIFVLSSRYEGFGMVIIEAMACGLPVVSFACPCGPSDIITHGENGYLIQNEDTKDLANKICHLIEQEELRKEMGIKAREASLRYAIPTIMREWVKLYDSLSI